MNATVTIDSGRNAWHATSRSNLRPAFRAALRHSRRVRVLRVALPAAVIVTIAGYSLAHWFSPWAAVAMLPSAGKLVVSGTRITMDLPKLAGYTRDGRSYELTAAAAAQDLRRPQFIELKDIRAKVELQDRSLVNVAADTGVYDTKTEAVSLNENIVVTASSGYEVHLAEAQLDMRKGHIVSNKPVAVLLANGRVDAKQLEVTEAGDVINFRGGVMMVISPDGSAAGASRQDRQP